MSTSDERVLRLASRLRDDRSRRVLFVSHCLLNQNVRYLGGATHPGVAPPAVGRFIEDGTGLYQMPCPEQVAWGGVMKRLVLRFYGAEGSWLYRLRGLVCPLFLLYTRWRYRRLAKRAAKDIADYARSGFEIVGVLGVGDSPSCGVRHTLDMRRALPIVASVDVDSTDSRSFNARAVRALIVDGEGLFMKALRRQLQRRNVSVAFSEWDPEVALPLRAQ